MVCILQRQGIFTRQLTGRLPWGAGLCRYFPATPGSGAGGRVSSEDIDEFRRRREKSGIYPVFSHIPYLVNLASPYPVLCRGSIKAYIEDIKETEALGIEYLVTHMGSHKESGEEIGLKRITSALNKILERTKKSPVKIILENTSGSGSWLGYKFEHQRQVIDGIEQKERVGICFDTCHGFAAGYDLSTPEGAKETINQLDKIVGLERLKLIHLNDSRDKLNSRRDRHEHIGKGKIGREGLRGLLRDRRLKDAAFILETPKETETSDKRNLALARKLSGV